MTPDYDDAATERIVAAKRRLTDLRFRALLDQDQPMADADDLDAVADEILAGLDHRRPLERDTTVRVNPVAG
jgi:hypothetical protein